MPFGLCERIALEEVATGRLKGFLRAYPFHRAAFIEAGSKIYPSATMIEAADEAREILDKLKNKDRDTIC